MNTDISLPVTVKIALANTFVLISICDHRPDSIFCCAALAARDNCLLNTCKKLDIDNSIYYYVVGEEKKKIYLK